MTRRLLLSYLTITALVLLVLEVPLGISYARRELEQLTNDLERDARVLATVVEDQLEGRTGPDPSVVVQEYAARTGARVVVVDAQGVSIADSDRPGEQRDFSTRPEFERALQGDTASGTRRSTTLDTDLVYVAVPVASGGRILGAVRVTYPRSELDDRVRRSWIALGALAGVVLATVVIVGTVLARSVTRPVRSVVGAADALAGGNLTVRAPESGGPPEIRALARQFNAMAMRLEQLVSAQRAFVADASHELRAPLTALRLRLENIESAAPDDARPDIEAAADEVNRLSHLVDALLHLARAESGSGQVETVDLAAEVRARVDAWLPLADEQGIELRGDSPDRMDVRAPAGAVAQILDNLLANAFEVAPAGSHVDVVVTANGSEAELRVVDEGAGLSAEERERAFDRFWRARGAAPGGSGIGLAIVAQLVAISGGSAELQPGRNGSGTAAVIRLPRN